MQAQSTYTKRRHGWIACLVLLAAAAGLVVMRWPGLPVQGTVASASGLRADVTLGVYQVVEGTAVPVGEALRPDDALLFSYDNRGTPGYPFLLVVAVDANGGLHWFDLAGGGGAPGSMRLMQGTHWLDKPLHPEPALAAGPLVIYGIFSQLPVQRTDVDAAIKQARQHGWSAASPPPLPLVNTTQTRVATRVRDT